MMCGALVQGTSLASQESTTLAAICPRSDASTESFRFFSNPRDTKLEFVTCVRILRSEDLMLATQMFFRGFFSALILFT